MKLNILLGDRQLMHGDTKDVHHDYQPCVSLFTAIRPLTRTQPAGKNSHRLCRTIRAAVQLSGRFCLVPKARGGLAGGRDATSIP